MFKSIKTRGSALLLACFLSLAALPAFATGGTTVDVSAVVDAIEAAATPIGLIGASVLIVLVAIKVYKWVRRAM